VQHVFSISGIHFWNNCTRYGVRVHSRNRSPSHMEIGIDPNSVISVVRPNGTSSVNTITDL
jgi:hypothetical protein